MKKIMKRSDSNRGIAPKNLSLAFLLSLAIIGAGCEQSQAAQNTPLPTGEGRKMVQGTSANFSGEGSIQSDNMQINQKTVNQVKKSLSSGKKSNKVFKSLSDKLSNNTPLPTGEGRKMVRGTSANFSGEGSILTTDNTLTSHVILSEAKDFKTTAKFMRFFGLHPQNDMKGTLTGAAAEYTPILDNLYESGDSTVQSAYQLIETTATSGNNVFKIGDKYYQLTYKDSFYEQFTNPTLDRAYEAGESSISSAYTLTETTATSGTNVYKIGDKYYQFAIKDGVTSGGRITTNQNGNPVTTHIFGSVVNNSNGAAINNPKNGIIGNVTGDFANNQAKNTYAYGGAIANRTANCSIGDILGDFIGNSVYGGNYQMGGAIHSTKIIGDITGNFINNGSARKSTNGYGGAIYIEYGTAGNITGNFIGNHIDATYGYGGAIATDNNAGTIGDITGVFIGNRASGEGSRGGAIFNEGTMGNITGDFIENYSRGDAGAIYNYSGSMGNVNADFINNTATYSGGAIYNRAGTIGDVSGNFISNHAVTHGGAISTKADITLLADNTNNIISGNWIGTEDNKQYEAIYVENTTANLSIEAANGGVWTIYDYINGATGYNLTLTGDNTGVVDYNNDLYGSPNLTIENVTLDVSDGETNTYNLTSLTSTDGQISVDVNYDTQTADKLVTTGEATGTVYISGLNFTGTKTTGDTYQILDIASGDAQLAFGDNIKIIENGEETEFHEGFIFTPSMVDSTVQYGDIYASTEGLMLATTNTTNDSITINPEEIFDQILTYLNQKETTDERNFNFVTSGDVYTVTLPVGTTTAGTLNINGVAAAGGAKSTIDFNNTDGFNLANASTLNIENTKLTNATNSAIRVTNANAEVNLTNVDFEDNTAANGGAIYNNGATAQIGDIEGNFSNNSATSETTTAYGGAIYNYNGTLGSITGDFTSNALNAQTAASGGAIYNSGATAQIGDIEGNFSGNTATSETSYAYGGAIYNANGTLGSLTGDFTSNSTTAASSTEGGALYNTGTIGDITGNFLSNSISGGKNGNGGAIRNAGTIGKITGNFINTSAVAGEFSHGGAICNTSSIDQISGNFIDNYAKSTSDTYLALGGAIYHSGDENTLNIVADGKDVVFDGNYTEDYRGKINNAIFVVTNRAIAIKDDDNVIIGYEYENSTPKLTLNATNDGRFILNDNIDGGGFIFDDVYDGTHHGTHLERNHQYDLEITGDDTGVVHLNNDILNANITHENVTTNVGDWSYLSHAAGEGINSLTMNSGVMNIPYLTTEPVTLSSFNMNGGTINLDRVDVDLEGIRMGRFIADDYSGGAGTINVNSLNLLNATDRLRTEIPFADTSFANTVRYNGEKVIAASPIYIYDVAYENLSDGGYFSFTRKNNEFNPAVLVSPVATQIAGQATMNQAFQYVFEHADAFTQMPAMDRFARIHSNEYALSTDFNNNLGTLNALSMNKGVWVRPYTSFDKTDLKNGPEVKSINYGTIIGADTEFRKMKNGWTNVGTGYIGYFGSQVDFKGVDTSMNGGLLGVTETFYKGNFFTALTASAGGGFAESHTMYGKEDLTTVMAGVASKTGYNFEFKEGKFIVQPILKMDYTMINTFDYTNAAGVKLDNKPMHTIQINPSVRFIGNLKGGWQPYASVGMVWNLMNETDVRANGVELPGMHTKPYIEYGVGIQRHWNERFTAFGQAMVRNGGRTGVALTAGFRWALGKDEPKEENEKNVKREEPVKVIKGERSHSTGAAVTAEPVVVKQTPAINTERVLYKSNALTKEEIAARTANLSKYNALIK